MARIHMYSQASCVKCDASLRAIGSAITRGQLDPAAVTVHLIDGVAPRAGKIHEKIAVERLEDPAAQDEMRSFLRNHAALGPSAPAFIVRDDEGAEIVAWNDFRPDLIARAITLVATATSASAATS